MWEILNDLTISEKIFVIIAIMVLIISLCVWDFPRFKYSYEDTKGNIGVADRCDNFRSQMNCTKGSETIAVVRYWFNY